MFRVPPTRLQRKCNTPFLSSITAFHPLPSKAWTRPPFVLARLAGIHLWLGGTAGALGGADLEAVLEAPGDGGQGAHAAGAGGLSALGLLGPVVCCALHVSIQSLYVCAWAGPLRHPPSFVVDSSLEGSASSGWWVGWGGLGSFVHVHFRVLAAGYPQEAQVCFWMCMERRPSCRQYLPVSPFVLAGCPPSCPIALDIPHSVVLRVVNTDHSDGTECASCCGAFRKSWFPSLYSIVSQCRRRRKFRYRWRGGVGRTHFACLSVVGNVSSKIQTSGMDCRAPIVPLLVSNGGKGDGIVAVVDGVAGLDGAGKV